MPLFEFKCTQCGFRFEELMGSRAAKPPKCPKCATAKTERQLSTFSASVHEGGSSRNSDSCSTGTCPFG
ncbi:MAG: zinc ribbon domain-containing protein [Verrucomicrobiota bacterium]|nr:zinc ribbon domain-containing protein [Verrucomicrobiota bacterium]